MYITVVFLSPCGISVCERWCHRTSHVETSPSLGRSVTEQRTRWYEYHEMMCSALPASVAQVLVGASRVARMSSVRSRMPGSWIHQIDPHDGIPTPPSGARCCREVCSESPAAQCWRHRLIMQSVPAITASWQIGKTDTSRSGLSCRVQRTIFVSRENAPISCATGRVCSLQLRATHFLRAGGAELECCATCRPELEKLLLATRSVRCICPPLNLTF